MKKTFEIEIEYEGGKKETYKVTTDFAALAMIEERTSPVAIMQRIARVDMRMSDFVYVIYCCIVASGYDVKEHEIGDAFNQLGLDQAFKIAAPILDAYIPEGILKRKPGKQIKKANAPQTKPTAKRTSR
jgi:hypothetical protein